METTTALGLLLLAFGIYSYTKGSAAGRLIFYPGTITSMDFVGNSPIATVQILVQNTSNVDITVYSLAGNVFSNNQLVGNVSNFTPVVIRNNSQTTLPVTVQFQLLGLVNDIIRAFQSGSFTQNIEIQGTANADGVAVPINMTFKVG